MIDNAMNETTVEKVRSHIQKHDRLIEIFGMDIDDVQEGRAVVSMTVGPDHLNAAFICHGAAIYALADVAFALAGNSSGKMALALECAINYMRPAEPGARLVAEAAAMHQGRQTGVYTVNIRDGQGRNVAFFKATAFRVDAASLPEKLSSGTK